MKVFVIFEDDPKAPGGVKVDVMPQMTIAELGEGIKPFSSHAGQCALLARDYIDDMRVKAFLVAREIISREVDKGQGPCLH